MMSVSVFSSPSDSPALSIASCSSDSGWPCASVRLSMPTIRMSMAPSAGFSTGAASMTSAVVMPSVKPSSSFQ